MSYIDSISQASTASETGGSSTKKSATSDVMGKEDFLSLLVAQLQNQDPLNPDDPTEFTAQLAQFSSLEQLFNLNDSMQNLVTSNANSDKFSTLQTIGKNVVYQASKFEYKSGDTVELGYQLDGEATEVSITVQKDGVTVAQLSGEDLDKGNHFLSWDGTTSSGTAAESGSYTISISAKAAEGSSVAAAPLIKSEVTGVDLTGDYGGKLLTNAGEVAFTSILGVYDISDKPADPADPEPGGDNSTNPATQENKSELVNVTEKKSLLQAVTDDAVSSLADKYRIPTDGQINLNVRY